MGSLLFLCLAIRAAKPETLVRSLGGMVRVALGSTLALTVIFAAMCSAKVDSSQQDLGHPSSRVQAIATVIFCTLLYVLRPYDARLSQLRAVKGASMIGVVSYSLYLVHTSVLPYVDAGFRRAGFTENWYLVPYVLQILSALVAGWLFFELVERKFISKKQVRRIVTER